MAAYVKATGGFERGSDKFVGLYGRLAKTIVGEAPEADFAPAESRFLVASAPKRAVYAVERVSKKD
jgi:hypothetical protein